MPTTVSDPALPIAGVELGGTKCICTLAFDPSSILDQRTIPTTRPDETIPAIAEVLREWESRQGMRGLGIASFGPIGLDPDQESFGHILTTNKPGWSGASIRDALAAPFDFPVGFDTDVNGAALAEMQWGCGRGLDDFAYVTVGTGVGVGLIVDGKPTRGMGHSEIGHIRVPRLAGDKAPSACIYHDDCIEGLASGPALANRIRGRSFDMVSPDDPLWDPIVEYLAAMCHALVCTTRPHRIAIGGGVASSQPHLLPRIEAALIRSINGYLDLPTERPYVVAPELGAQAGPLGSIALANAAISRRSPSDR